jgi:hypothetical protein
MVVGGGIAMKREILLGWCTALVIACSDDGVSTTNDESSTGTPETTDPDDDGPDDGTDPSATMTNADSSSSSSDATTGTSSSDTSTSDTGSSDTSTSDTGSSDTGSSDTGSSSSSDSSTTSVESSSTGEASSSDDSPLLDLPSDDGECNTYDQDCPDGEKCNAYADDGGGSWNALGCFPVDPMPDAPGEPCTVVNNGVSGLDSCELGAMCWNADPETNIGTCVANCQGSAADPVCADPTTFCVIENEGSLNLCLPMCDPLVQDCTDGEACYPIDDYFVCAPDASGGMGFYGQECNFINVCQPGLYCAPPELVPDCAGGFGCCSPFCDVSDPLSSAACPGSADGQECVPWYAEGEAPPGFEDVGACGIPV